jgi:hypothetical protein
MVVDVPAQIVGSDAETLTVGIAEILNVTFDDMVPHSLVTEREIVCVPTEENEIEPGFANVEVAGVPPPKVQA